MALNGRVNGICKGSNYTKYSLWIDWLVNSQNIAGNKSNITVSMKVQRNDGVRQSAYNLNSTNPVSLSVGGVVRVSNKIGIDTRNNKIITLASWTGDISHNDDGTLNLALSGSFSISGASTLTGGAVSGTAIVNSISCYPGSVAVCTVAQDGDKINYNRGTVTIAWSGASGVITGYKIERAITGRNNSTFGAWETVKTVTSSATSGSTTDIIPATYMSGTKFKYRVTTLNGSLASAAKESNVLTVRGGARAKPGDSWLNVTIWAEPYGNPIGFKEWELAKCVYAKSEDWKESI